MNKHCVVAPVLLAIVFAAHSPDAAAQCTIGRLTSGPNWQSVTPPQGMGQSFTACETGFVTSISFIVDGTPYPMKLGLQAGTELSPQSNPQTVSVVEGPNTIVLDTPFPVTKGTIYSFGLLPTSVLVLHLGEGDSYAGGTRLWFTGDVTIPDETHDLVFSVEIAAGVVPTQPATWGRIKVLYR